MAGAEMDKTSAIPHPYIATDEMVKAWCENSNKDNKYNQVIINNFRFKSGDQQTDPKTIILFFPKSVDESGFVSGELSRDEQVLTFLNAEGQPTSINPIVINQEQEKTIRKSMPIISHPFVPIFTS